MVAVLTDSRLRSPAPVHLAAAARLRVSAPRRLDPTVYRRRRLLVAGIALLMLAAALVTAQSLLAGAGGGPLTATGAAAGPPGSMLPAGTQGWVVRPGDTLWTIARAVEPHGDVRPLVDRLSAEVHDGELYPGEVIPLPPVSR